MPAFGKLQWIVGDLRTGRINGYLPVIDGTWTISMDGPGVITGDLLLADSAVAALKPRDLAGVGKNFLAAVWLDKDGGETFLEAGPIWTHEYDDTTRRLRIGAAGLWSYYDHRKSVPVYTNATTVPSLTTTYTGLSLGTIAKRLVQLAHTHTGGSLPVVLPVDEAGTDTRTYPAYELGWVGDGLRELSRADGGPEIQFVPRRTSASALYLEWQMQVGTIAAPFLTQTSLDWVWDTSVPQSIVTSLSVNRDGTAVASRAWVPGSGYAESRIVAVATDTTLTTAGWPLLETEKPGYDTIESTSTLASVAGLEATVARYPWETWRLSYNAASGGPAPGQVRPGHWGRVVIGTHPYLPAGDFRGRVVQVSGDTAGNVSVQFQPAPGAL